MKVSFEDEPGFLAAVHKGVIDALRSPEFLRALAAEMGPEVIWLTTEQARGVTQLSPSTFVRWVRRYRAKGLVISYALGRKEPRYRLDGVQQVLLSEAAGAPTGKDLVALPTTPRSAVRKSNQKTP